MLTLFAGIAWAGGGGAYAAIDAGGGWTDRLGPVIRGAAGDASMGGYFGHFRGTYRFGDYWRIGAQVEWNPIKLRDYMVTTSGASVRDQHLVESLYMPGLEIGRGADLMNIGACWWSPPDR